MEQKKFVKMSELVDKDFTVEKVWGYKWKKWDNVAKTMLTSDTYVPEHSKKYDVDTDKGKLDVSATQFGSMLEGVSRNGEANIVGKTFHVKSNGKSGMEIRYYINPVRTESGYDKAKATANNLREEEPEMEKIDLDSIPF